MAYAGTRTGLGLGNLTALCLSDIIIPSVPIKTLIDIIRNSPNLDKIKLKYFHCQKDDAIHTTLSPPVSLPHLTHLCLIGVSPILLDSVLANVNPENLGLLRLTDNTGGGPRQMQHLTRVLPNGESMLSSVFKSIRPKDFWPRIMIKIHDFPLSVLQDDGEGFLKISLSGNGWHPQLMPALSALQDLPTAIHLILDGNAIRAAKVGSDLLSGLPFLTQLRLECEWEEARLVIVYLSRHRETGWACPRLSRIDLPRVPVDGEEIVKLLWDRRFAGLAEGGDPLQIFGPAGEEFSWDRSSF